MSGKKAADSMVTCEVCDIQFMSNNHYVLHTKGMVHSQRAKEAEKKKENGKKTPPLPSEKKADSPSTTKPKPPEEEAEKSEDVEIAKRDKTPDPPKIKPLLAEFKPDDHADDVHCEACNVFFKTMQQFLSHVKGLGHIQNVEQFESKNRPQTTVQSQKTEEVKQKEKSLPPGSRNRPVPASLRLKTDSLSEEFHCETCNINLPSLLQFSRHVHSNEHLQTAQSILQDSHEWPKRSSRGPLLPSPKALPSSSRGPLLPSPKGEPQSPRGPLLPSPKALPSSSRGPLLPEPSGSTPWERHNQEQHTEESDFFCDVCEMQFETPQQFQSHVRGVGHHQRVQQPTKKPQIEVQAEDFGFCDLCNISFYTVQDYQVHLKGKAHLYKRYPHLNPIKQTARDEAPPLKESNEHFCEVCAVTCAGPVPYESHLNGQKHRKRLKAMGMKATNQRSVVDSATPPFGADELRCQHELDNCMEPLIGLEFLTEYHPAKPQTALSYRCGLCQCTFTQSSLISHIIGLRHRLKFYEHYDLGMKVRDHRGVLNMRPAVSRQYAEEIERRQGRKRMKIKKGNVDEDEGDVEIDMSNVEMLDEWSESEKHVDHRMDDVDHLMEESRRDVDHRRRGGGGRMDVDDRMDRRKGIVIEYGHQMRENIREDVDHRMPNRREQRTSFHDGSHYHTEEAYGVHANYNGRQQQQHKAYEQHYMPRSTEEEEASKPDPVAEFHKRLQAVTDNRAAQGYEADNYEGGASSSNRETHSHPEEEPMKREWTSEDEPMKRPMQDEHATSSKAKRSKPSAEGRQLDNQKMLQSLASCMMSSDDDVQLALKVSNALAKAILEYRLRHIDSYEAGEELAAQLKQLTDEADNICEQVQEGASIVQGEKLLSLVQSMVQSEQDLETAMQVSNALTKAILDYRMKALIDMKEAPSPHVASPPQPQVPSSPLNTYAHSTPSSTPYAPSPSTYAPSPSTYAPSSSTYAPSSSTYAPSPSTYAPSPSTYAPSSSTHSYAAPPTTYSSFMPQYAMPPYQPQQPPYPMVYLPGASMLDAMPPSPPPPPPPEEEKPPLPDSPPPGVFCKHKHKKSFRFGL